MIRPIQVRVSAYTSPSGPCLTSAGSSSIKLLPSAIISGCSKAKAACLRAMSSKVPQKSDSSASESSAAPHSSVICDEARFTTVQNRSILSSK